MTNALKQYKVCLKRPLTFFQAVLTGMHGKFINNKPIILFYVFNNSHCTHGTSCANNPQTQSNKPYYINGD